MVTGGGGVTQCPGGRGVSYTRGRSVYTHVGIHIIFDVHFFLLL